MNVVCIGGGVSGQLVKLRVPQARVLDYRKAPTPMTRQFGGNYLWEPLPGVSCRSFLVRTTVDGAPPTEASVLEYKRKIGKGLDANWRDQFVPERVGYDIERWPCALPVEYDMTVTSIDMSRKCLTVNGSHGLVVIPYDVLVSTIPLPSLIEMIPHLPVLRLKHKPIYVHVSPIPPDAAPTAGEWRVNYISDPLVAAYRTTDRDGLRHYEALTSTGIATKRISPGKIFPSYEAETMVSMLEGYGIYCFGRFGRWNPEELVHETDASIRGWAARLGV